MAKAIGIVCIAIAAWVAYLLLQRVLIGSMRASARRVADPAHQQRIMTLILLLASITKYVVIFVVIIVILNQLGINTAPILAGAGVVGLAVGFGAQNLVRDVVSGFFIIMDGQYGVGDLVEINGVFGRVEEVGLRLTKLRDPSGQLRYFPNGNINSTSNYTGKHIAYVITFPLPANISTDPIPLVRALLDDFEREFRVFAEPPEIAMDDLPNRLRIIRVHVRIIPGRHPLVEQKLAARLAPGLENAGYQLTAPAEVSVTLAYPSPGTPRRVDKS